ncbi:uncharacterized protein LOC144452332 [Glandiceps talaboti]
MSAAQEVAEVANRCREAQTTRLLDLSSCSLKAIPDAVFFFFSETKPETCDFSKNVLKRIPAKIGQKFPQIKVFNMASNCLSSLPATMVAMTNLSILDLSSNAFSVFPEVIYSLSSLEDLNVENNQIESINMAILLQRGKLKMLNLKYNPLNEVTHNAIEECKHHLSIQFSDPHQDEEMA